MSIYRYRSFFFGQILMGLWLNCADVEGLPFGLYLASYACIRGWDWVNLCLGGLWQLCWLPEWNWRLPLVLPHIVSHSFFNNFFWFLNDPKPAQDPLSLALQQGFLAHWAELASVWIRQRLLNWDLTWGPWFLLFAFGLNDGKPVWFTNLYRQLGLLHVLVVSGSHFSFLGRWLQFAIEGPGRCFYAWRWLRFPHWLQLVIFERFLLSAASCFFGILVGFNPPCQRAFLSLLVLIWLPLIAGPQTRPQVDRWVMSGQAICFPNSFFSLSNALSWSAYALVRCQKPWPKVWQRLLLPGVEGPLIAVNLAYFGIFSPIGVLLNPCLGPIWHLLLILGLGVLIWPESILGQWLRLSLDSVHQSLLAALHWQEKHQGAAELWLTDVAKSPFRVGLWLLASWALLRLWCEENPTDEAC